MMSYILQNLMHESFQERDNWNNVLPVHLVRLQDKELCMYDQLVLPTASEENGFKKTL